MAAMAVALTAVAPASAAPTACKSSDLRYSFNPGGPKTFGVFNLRQTATTCKVARYVAKEFGRKYESTGKLPKRAGGFAIFGYTSGPQQVTIKATAGRKVVRFRYVVANG